MKKFYEINVACVGKVDTYIFKTKKEKNQWLVKYFTVGNGSNWGHRRYEHYLEKEFKGRGRPKSFESYILSLVKTLERIHIRVRHEIIIIREKTFEKVRKNT